MKFTARARDMLKALIDVSQVIGMRSTIPVLSNVKLQGGKTGVCRLEITGTDLDIEVIRMVDCDMLIPGTITMPCHPLLKALRSIEPETMIEIEVPKNGDAIIRAGRARYTLPTIESVDFPIWTHTDVSMQFTIEAAVLRGMIDDVTPCISDEETRYYLNGIFFHTTAPGQLRAVATDGHRLAMSDAVLTDPAIDLPKGIIVHRGTAKVLRKLIDKLEGPIDFTVHGMRRMSWDFGNTIVRAKGIDGTFPDYQRTVPADNNVRLTVNTQQARKALKRVMAMSEERHKHVKLSFLNGSALQLSHRQPGGGSASEEIECELTGDVDMEIGFNAGYFDEMLQSAKADVVCIEMSEPTAPTLFSSPGIPHRRFVLMPVRV